MTVIINIAMASDDDDSSNACISVNNALRINPAIDKNSAVVSSNIGMILSKPRLNEKAARHLKHSVSLNPDYGAPRRFWIP